MARKKEVTAERIGVIYARYSSHAQREESIEQQVEECKAFAADHGIKIVNIYADKAITGKTDKRPAFQRMMREAAQQKWNTVIAYKSNRIARNMLNALMTEDKLSKYGIQTLYAKEEFGDSAAGRFALRTMMSVNQFYSENMAEDIRRGLRDNATKGLCIGVPPFGYRRGPDGKYEINPDEAPVVQEIYKAFVDGQSMAAVARSLNDRGIRTRQKKEWGKNSFHAILSNEKYTGVYLWQDIRIEGGMPVIIDRDTFDRAQQYMIAKPHPKGKTTQEDYGEYLLTGKLFCGLCGAPMTAMAGTSKTGELYPYYACRNKRRAKACTKENVRKEVIERRVTEIVTQIVLSDDVLDQFADITIKFQQEQAGSTEPLKEELAQKNAELENYFTAIGKGIFIPAMQDKMEQIQTAINDLKAKIKAAEQRQQRVFTKEDIIQSIKTIMQRDPNDLEFQKLIISSFVKEVYLFDDKLRILLRPGICDDELEFPVGDLDCRNDKEFAYGQRGATLTRIGELFTVFVMPGYIIAEIEFSNKKDLI